MKRFTIKYLLKTLLFDERKISCKNITVLDFAVLTNIKFVDRNNKRLAEMWSELNSFKWPEELFDPEGIFACTKYCRTKSIIDLIEIFIGKEECLKEWRKCVKRKGKRK